MDGLSNENNENLDKKIITTGRYMYSAEKY